MAVSDLLPCTGAGVRDLSESTWTRRSPGGENGLVGRMAPSLAIQRIGVLWVLPVAKRVSLLSRGLTVFYLVAILGRGTISRIQVGR